MFAAFGPLRFLDALPWLIGAAALRVIAFGQGWTGLIAYYVATVAVVVAFIATTRRAIEALGGRAELYDMTFWQDLRISFRMFNLVHGVILGVTLALSFLDRSAQAVHFLNVVDGMAFDQVEDLSKLWSASVAALVLVMIVSADTQNGKVGLSATVGNLLTHWRWLGIGVVALALAYVGLSGAQGVVREAIRTFWQTSDASQFTKNLMFFVFIFSFAIVRLWVTVLVLTYSLKQSYLGAERRSIGGS